MNELRFLVTTSSIALLLVSAASAGPTTTTTTRVSVDSGGAQANGSSSWSALSADGRAVVFCSTASNLVAGDTNGVSDAFVHDRASGATIRVSVDSSGVQANSHSCWDPALSADGRFVVFTSFASNLVVGDTNGRVDVFVHDRQSGATTRASVDSAGFQASGHSYRPAISGDGRFVAFDSVAANLVAGDTNGRLDVFVHDRQGGATTRVSVASDGVQANRHSLKPTISAAGRFVTFESEALNLVAGDTNNADDAFVHDRANGATIRVSVASNGAQGNDLSAEPAISGDGRFVAFRSLASNLVAGDTNNVNDVFVHDRSCGRTARVSVASGGAQANSDSHEPAISANGRFAGFFSVSSNLVAGDTNGAYDIFVHDRHSNSTTRVSVSNAGTQGNQNSQEPSLSVDGRTIAFYSGASNLVAGDTNAAGDVFVHERPLRPGLMSPCA